METIKQIKKILEEIPPDYVSAKKQSQHIDEILGIQYDVIEKRLSPSSIDKQNWSHLHPQAHQTPYSELIQILRELNLPIGSTLIDLGSGYGRMGLMMQIYFPELLFLGYELEPERVNEAKRIFRNLQLNENVFTQQDIGNENFQLPDFDCAFIYDFGTLQDMRRILEKFKLHRKMILVARGRGIRHLIMTECPWLMVNEPRHFDHWSIYYVEDWGTHI